jgi:hypothetical protein
MARIALAVSLLWLAPAQAQSLPLVDDLEWGPLREHGRVVVDALKKLDAPLPAETARRLQTLLEQEKPADPQQAARDVQKLLDAHCLIGVSINPESRVKAARGPRKAELVRDQASYLLIKVHNEGGVTHPLAVASEQAVVARKKDTDRWIELGICNDRPFAARLSGKHVEYRVLKLVARQAGKREATLAFDVGQGTQDLGFRAEVPILFTIRGR